MTEKIKKEWFKEESIFVYDCPECGDEMTTCDIDVEEQICCFVCGRCFDLED